MRDGQGAYVTNHKKYLTSVVMRQIGGTDRVDVLSPLKYLTSVVMRHIGGIDRVDMS